MPGMPKEKRAKYFDIPKGKFSKDAGKGDATRGSVAKQRAGLGRIFGENCPKCRTRSKNTVAADPKGYWCDKCEDYFEVM